MAFGDYRFLVEWRIVSDDALYIQIEMLEYRWKRLEAEPLKLNILSFSTENMDSLEFRRVICKGVFDEEKSVYVGPRSRSISGVTENGYYVVTPLMPIPNNPERYVQVGFNCYSCTVNDHITDFDKS